ncbi:MAG TPA: DoxX family protein [Longimicrobiales bacterium]|nr:DoxX family protein [Longimicrobiales bacterium]
MTGYFELLPATELAALSSGLLVARLVLGSYMAAHGAQKLFGWFGGYGLANTTAAFEQMGFRPGRAFVVAASLTEIVSGVLVAAGFLGPIGPALMISVLIVAAVTVHWQHGLFVTSNGIEHTAIFGASALALALTGPGLFSLDAVLGIDAWWSPRAAWLAIAVAVVGAVTNLSARRLPRKQTQDSTPRVSTT